MCNSTIGFGCIISLRKHPFLLALRRWERFAKRPQRRRARRNGCFRRLRLHQILYQLKKILGGAETSPGAKSEEKRMFSQATAASNPIPIATHNVSTVTDNTYTVKKITQSAKGTVLTPRGFTLFRFTTINL